MIPANFRSFLRTATLATLALGLLSSLTMPAHAADRTAELQKLVNDFGFQLKLVQRVDGRVMQQRLQQLAVARDRWNNSTRTDADFQVMKAWLEGAIRATMPGSSEPMPELPWFPNRVDRTPAIEESAGETTVDTAGKNSEQAEPVARAQAEVARTNPAPALPAEMPAELAVSEPSPSLADIWTSHPAAKPIDLGNPFEDDRPLVVDTSVADISIAETSMPRVAMRPTGLSVEPDRPAVGVNVAELEARVRGYIHGLRGVEARLLASPDMKFDELRTVVRELKQLASQRELVGMYLDSVATGNSNRAAELPEVSHAKRMVAGRLDKLRQGDTQTDAAIDTLTAMLSEI